MTAPPLAAWAAATLVAHSLAAVLFSYAALRDPAHTVHWRPRSASISAWLVRAAFFVGVPYLALLGGAATPAQMALAWPDGAMAGTAALWTIAALAAGVPGVWLLNRIARRFYPEGVRPLVRRRAQLTRPWGFAFLLLDTLYLQAHWTFYRAAAADALGAAPLDAVALGGLTLVAVEWLLDPRWWRDMTRAGVWEDRALVAVLAAFSAALYPAAANFFVLLAAHAVLWLGWIAAAARLFRVQAALGPALPPDDPP